MARDREMMPQGSSWKMFGESYWSAEQIAKEGIDVYIAPDELMELEITIHE